jgi:hypothetical protein
VFHVSNPTGAPISVTFPTGQTFDFRVSREGRTLWTWSADRAFTQAIRRETLAAGATWRYEGIWEARSAPAGVYEVQARLASTTHPVEARAEVELP